VCLLRVRVLCASYGWSPLSMAAAAAAAAAVESGLDAKGKLRLSSAVSGTYSGASSSSLPVQGTWTCVEAEDQVGSSDSDEEEKKHGFCANKYQVLLQVMLAALTGISLRLVLLPEGLLADDSKPSKTDFLVYFGVSKAFSDILGGTLADQWGRKRASLLGWGIGVLIAPVSLLGYSLRSRVLWNCADILLGTMQGLTWGLNIICLMDLLGPKGRGMASALSNAVGYFGSALTSPVAAHLVAAAGDARWSIAALAVSTLLGLLVCMLSTDTGAWAKISEAKDCAPAADSRETGKELNLGCSGETQVLCSLAGNTVNMATALVWGSALLWIKGDGGISIEGAGLLEGWFTGCKVVAMLGAGWSSCCVRPKPVAAAALVVLALGLLGLALQALSPPANYWQLMISTAMVGVGVGGAFPVLAASVTENLPSHRRASVYGAYRMWRDLGYAGGGLASRVASGSFIATCFGVCAWSAGVAAMFGVRMVLAPCILNWQMRQLQAQEISSGSDESAASSSAASE